MKPSPASPRQAEAKAQERLKALNSALRAAAKNPDVEDSIHDLRVAIRRFKQVLRIYAAYFDRVRKMRRSLRSLMELCGAARNCDVALEVLEAAGLPAGRALKRDLQKHRAKATRDLAAELKDWGIPAHMRRWHEWLTAKPGDGGPAKSPSPELSREFLQAGAAAARAGVPYAQMHKFRLLVKKTRYASEILGAPESRLVLLRGLQDCLGAINDCVTTSDLIAEMEVPLPERRKIKTALSKLTATRSADFRTYWNTHLGRKHRPGRTK